MRQRIIFHIDVNNAFLSWTAVKMLQEGSHQDIRKIASVIGGNEQERHGIVLAKSPIAKKYGITTAETLYSARRKYPQLKTYPPDYAWYYNESNIMYNYLTQYTPKIERYSIDECFLDLTGTSYLYKDYLKLAYQIKNDIKNKFGFTVNVGIGNNKLCAKMASDFEKPDKVHTLYQSEIETKMWPLPVGDLFMVGKSTSLKLQKLGIITIRDLANTNYKKLEKYFKSQARLLVEFANGIDYSKVTMRSSKSESISVSETLPYDCADIEKLKEILFRQTEEVTRTLREQKQYAKTVAITYKNSYFETYQKQTKLQTPENRTINIYKVIIKILEDSWKDEAIRNIGVRLSDFTDVREEQVSLFTNPQTNHLDDMQEIIDNINKKYGTTSVMPASIKKIGNSSHHKKRL